jgi:DNA-binding response OmpR family regulator
MVGADSYMVKPFPLDDLVVRIGRLLTRARAEQPADQP